MTWEERISHLIVADEEEEHKRKLKIARIMRAQERRATELYLVEHQSGYCPHCHTLLPLSGNCDCGYCKH